VIALQDIYAFGSRRREALIERAYANGFRYWVASSAKGFQDQSGSKAAEAGPSKSNIDGGLLILSRFSIRRCERMTFERGIGTDKNIARGILYAKVAVGENRQSEKYVHVFNTSLQASGTAEASACEEVRTKQLYQLKQFIDAQVQKELTMDRAPRIFLAGSFNINARTDATSEGNSLSESEEYHRMIQVLDGAAAQSKTIAMKSRDLLHAQYGEHPNTFLQSDKKGRNHVSVDTVLELRVAGSVICDDQQQPISATLHPFIIQEKNATGISSKTTLFSVFILFSFTSR
jgi:hypothetical protein